MSRNSRPIDMAGNARVRAFQPCPVSVVFAPWSPTLARYANGGEARSTPTPRGVPSVAAATQGASTRPSGQPGGLSLCPAPTNRHEPTDQPDDDERHETTRKRGVIGDVRHPAFESDNRDRDPRTRLAGPRALQRRHGVDDRAVLLGAARRHRRGQGVLPGVPGEGDLPRGRPGCGASRGACGAASCS